MKNPVSYNQLPKSLQRLVRNQLDNKENRLTNLRRIDSSIKFWTNKNGLHRLDGPAVLSSRDVQYWTFGEPHNVNGPAIHCLQSNKNRYFIHGVSDYAWSGELRRLYFDKHYQRDDKGYQLALSLVLISSRILLSDGLEKILENTISHVKKTLKVNGFSSQAIQTIFPALFLVR